MRPLSAFGLLSLISCSSSSSGNSPASSGGDASDDAAPNNTMVCGSGSVSGTARATDPKSLGPVAGAAYSAPGCTSVVADARGYFDIKTDPTFLIKLDGTASGYAHEHVEFSPIANGFQATGYIWESSFPATLPGWSSSDGYVITLLNGTGGDSGPCVSAQGATLSIKGHPEIKASYFKDNVTIDPTLTSTAALAIAALGPIPPGSYEIDATKSGCTAAPLNNADFKFPATTTVSAGVITLQLMSLM